MAISSWGQPEEAPMISLPMRTVMTQLNVPPPPAGTPGPLSRPTDNALGGLLEGGGFSQVEVEQLTLEFDWDSADEFTRFTRDIVAPISAMLAQHPPEVGAAAWAAVTDAARPLEDDDGKLRLKNLVLLAAGTA